MVAAVSSLCDSGGGSIDLISLGLTLIFFSAFFGLSLRQDLLDEGKEGVELLLELPLEE